MKKPPLWKRLVIWLVLVALSGLGVLLVKESFFEGFEVPTASMVPTLRIGDIVWVDKTAYGITWPWQTRAPHILPERGDIVVFVHPTTKEFYVKRVVAFPGETVMVLGPNVWVNGVPLEQSTLLPQDTLAQWGQGWQDYRVEERQLSNGRRYRILSSVPTPLSAWEISGYWVVPPNMLFVLGDWRDESSDSRTWGALPVANLVGKARCVIDGGTRLKHDPIKERTGCHLE